MSENGPRRYSAVLKVLTIVTITGALTYLCVIRFGKSMVGTPTSSDRGNNNLSVAVNALNATAGGQVPENYTAYEHLWMNSRTRNTGTARDNSYAIGVSTEYDNRLPANHKHDNRIMTVDDQGVNSKTPNTDSGMKRHIYSNWETDKWSTVQDKHTGYGDSYDLTYNTGEHNQIDDFVGEYGSNLDRPVMESELLQDGTAYGSYDYSPNTPPSTNYYQPTIKNYHRPFSTNNRPLDMNFHPPRMIVKPTYPSVNSQPYTGLSWKTIGIMVLVKLGMVKLKAIAVLNTVFIVLFKLKLFLMAMFFKFNLLLKFLMFFNILVFPLYLLPTISMLARFLPTILMNFSKIFNRNNNFTPSDQIAAALSNYLSTIYKNDYQNPMSNGMSSQSSQSGYSTPFPISYMTVDPSTRFPLYYRPTTTSNNNQQMSIIPQSQLRNTEPNPPSKPTSSDDLLTDTNRSSPKQDDQPIDANLENTPVVPNEIEANSSNLKYNNLLYSPYEQNHKTLVEYKSTMEVFRKLLDSNTCVERIACQMAVVEKASNMALWINWVLHGVSKFISNKKLEFYFKTYNDVKDKILTITPIPKISELWCFERYKCNNANVTHVMDIKQ